MEKGLGDSDKLGSQAKLGNLVAIIEEKIKVVQKEILKWYVLNGKHTILNILLVLGVFVFIDPIKELLKALPSNLLLIEPSWGGDILWLATGVCLFISFWRYDVKGWEKFLNRFIVALGIIFGYCILFRNISGNRLVHLKATELICYFDIVFFVAFSWCCSPLIRFLYENPQLKKSHKKNKQEESEIKTVTPFIEDIPTDNQDELQRSAYAKTLADKIVATNPKRAFNIGIFGEWGSGKSDFINRIGKALRDQNDKEVIIVEFNPWRVGSNSSITEDYLQVLSKQLRPYSSRLSNIIGDYAKQFIDRSERQSPLKAVSNLVVDSVFAATTKEEQYIAIKNEVEHLGKTIVVFIDDLDRLNKEEILETFNLIRSVADFPKTFFVLGLDYHYVLETAFNIKVKELPAKDYIEKTPLYLEKVFQLEVPLTKIPVTVYMQEARKLLIAYFDKTEDFDSLETIYKIFYLLSEDGRSFKSFRQIKRFLNLYILEGESRKNIGINYVDLLILSFIKEFYNEYYELFLRLNYPSDGPIDIYKDTWQFESFNFKGNLMKIADLFSYEYNSIRYKSKYYLYFGDSLYTEITQEHLMTLLINFSKDSVFEFTETYKDSAASQQRVYLLLQDIVRKFDDLLEKSCVILIMQKNTAALFGSFLKLVIDRNGYNEKVFDLVFRKIIENKSSNFIEFSDSTRYNLLLTLPQSDTPYIEERDVYYIVQFYVESQKPLYLLFYYLVKILGYSNVDKLSSEFYEYVFKHYQSISELSIYVEDLVIIFFGVTNSNANTEFTTRANFISRIVKLDDFTTLNEYRGTNSQIEHLNDYLEVVAEIYRPGSFFLNPEFFTSNREFQASIRMKCENKIITENRNRIW